MKEQPPKENLDKYYKLKTKAVDELASALKEEPSEIKTEKPVPDPYKIDPLAKIPIWIKALFVKYWAAGAICYFGYWGLGLFFGDILDLVLFVGVLTGAVTFLLINPGFLYFESEKKEYHKFMLLPVSSKKLWALFVNILYGIIVTFAVFQIYAQLNAWEVRRKNLPEDSIPFPVEPLLYGLFFLAVDMLFVSVKNLFVAVLRKRKDKNS